MLLYRPTGLRELRLVAERGWRSWPPRLPEQPIFYPVLTFAYAEKIARDWNTRDEFSGFSGFVTRFQIDDRFAQRYPVQQAAGRAHEELWVPAEELDEFNRHIRGFIEVVAAFAGEGVSLDLDPLTHIPRDLEPPVVVRGEPGFSCPCCRALTLSMRSGFELCPICYWEDDGQDDGDADVVRGGPNGGLSLMAARSNFVEFGASAAEFRNCVRAPETFER